MTHSRSLTLGGILLAGATLALSQTPPPPPPVPAAPAAAPMAPTPMPAPRPVAVAAPAAPFEYLDLDQVITPEIQLRIDEARDRVNNMRLDMNLDGVRDQIDAARIGAEAARASADAVRESLRAVGPAIARATSQGIGIGIGNGFAFAPQIAPVPPTPPAVAGRGIGPVRIYNMSGDRAYSQGQSALDSRRWEDAVTYFSQVVSRGTTRVDGALYWKAYAQAKLGRKDDALATIAELRKSQAGSKWLDEAKALEVEVNQGRAMSPEAETDDEIKILILQQGLQTDFDRFYPALEKIIKGSGSPKLKRNALYVLADSSNPKAQALIEQVARGGGNPDLQVKAIQYMTERRRGTVNSNAAQILSEIYNSTSDPEVKREVVNGLMRLKDKDRLINILKNEKNTDLRRTAIGFFGEQPGNAELWQLYASETTPEGKIMILQNAARNGNSDKLLEVLRTEKDTRIRVAAARSLATYPVTDALVSVYSNEQDPQVKQAIIDGIYGQRTNGKALVDLAKAEKDPRMKIRMIERMSGRKDCKECSDYLLEILNK
jgi:hypothetical protein